jgi:hypothetical protein
MWRPIAVALAMLLGLVGCARDSTPVGTPVGDGTLSFAVEKLGDCDAVNDYPYARNLFCPAAFSAAQTMLAAVATSLGGESPSAGVFHYYQTRADPDAPPDDQAQTTVAGLALKAPWRESRIAGAGAPLCRLLAHVTSPGPVGAGGRGDDSVPDALRAYPSYFSRLYAAARSEPLDDFRPGGSFDPLVRGLGASGRDAFLVDYPGFSAAELYDPGDWRADPSYHGISGGGGGGWGGEISIERPGAAPQVVLAFGGGGGGGMTSLRTTDGAATTVGAGGGGGIQLADGYRYDEHAFDGLGLGAGVGADEAEVQYSYFDYAGSERPVRPAHAYHPDVIAAFAAQLRHVTEQLVAARASGATVVLRGGGGMGAGAEFLTATGAEIEPHALSTQAGFRFRYEIGSRQPGSLGDGGASDDEQEGAYAQLGELYRAATAQAYAACGRDYANYACVCPTTHAVVLRRMEAILGDPAKVPVWLRQGHCPQAIGG